MIGIEYLTLRNHFRQLAHPNLSPLQLDVRIARLAVFAVALVALTSSEAIKRNDQDRAALANDYASSNAVIRQRRSPVPPPKKKKPFKVSDSSNPQT